MNAARGLAPGARWALVIGLWIVLLVILGFAIRNFGWLATWAPGLLYGCFSICGLVIAFSLVAAAIHLSIDTIRGNYPY